MGPFAAYGIEAPDRPSLYDMGSMQHKHSDLDVMEHNMTGWMVELATGHAYVPPAADDAIAAAHAEQAKAVPSRASLEVIDEASESEAGGAGDAVAADAPSAAVAALSLAETPAVPDPVVGLQHVKVFLLHGDMEATLGRPRFARLFDRVYLGTAATVKVSRVVNDWMATQCVVTLDSAKYLYLLTAEQKAAYATNLTQQASDAGWRAYPAALLKGGEAASPGHVHFAVTRPAENAAAAAAQ